MYYFNKTSTIPRNVIDTIVVNSKSSDWVLHSVNHWCIKIVFYLFGAIIIM